MNRKQKKRREKLRREKLERPEREQAVAKKSPSAPDSPSLSIFAAVEPARLPLKAFWAGMGLLWKLVIAASIVLTVVGIYAFQPQVSVEEKDYSLDPADVTRTPFIVKNNGLFPVYSLTFGCHEGRTLSTDPRRRFFFEDNYYENVSYIGELDSGGRAETFCELEPRG